MVDGLQGLFKEVYAEFGSVVSDADEFRTYLESRDFEKRDDGVYVRDGMEIKVGKPSKLIADSTTPVVQISVRGENSEQQPSIGHYGLVGLTAEGDFKRNEIDEAMVSRLGLGPLP